MNKQDFLNALAKDLEKYLDQTSIGPDGGIYTIKQYIDTVQGLRIDIHPKCDQPVNGARNEHGEPHYHITSKQKNINAKFSIKGEFISNGKGVDKISSKDIKKIVEYFQENKKAEGIYRVFNSLPNEN